MTTNCGADVCSNYSSGAIGSAFGAFNPYGVSHFLLNQASFLGTISIGSEGYDLGAVLGEGDNETIGSLEVPSSTIYAQDLWNPANLLSLGFTMPSTDPQTATDESEILDTKIYFNFSSSIWNIQAGSTPRILGH